MSTILEPPPVLLDAPSMHAVRGGGHRIALLGDVGGHYDVLVRALHSLGVDVATHWIPPDLTVVQVGDLVHRGPASAEIVALVDTFLTQDAWWREAKAPVQWIQLWGNHEGHHIGGPQFGDPHRPYEVDDTTADTLARWYDDKLVKTAVAIRGEQGDILVTHAGMSRPYWEHKLDQPPTAKAVATTLNRLSLQETFCAGAMLGENRIAGVVWAECVSEVYISWTRAEMPFHQVHGHTSPYWWNADRWSLGRFDHFLRDHVRIDKTRRHSTATFGDKHIYGIDPGLGAYGNAELGPFIVHGTVL